MILDMRIGYFNFDFGLAKMYILHPISQHISHRKTQGTHEIVTHAFYNTY